MPPTDEPNLGRPVPEGGSSGELTASEAIGTARRAGDGEGGGGGDFSRRWVRFWLHGVLGLVVTTAVLLVVTFGMVHFIPGDPVRRAAGMTATPEQLQALRTRFGLDQPMWRQFTTYVVGMATFDWGRSFTSDTPVWAGIVAPRIFQTVKLVLAASGIFLVLSFVIGASVSVMTLNGRRARVGTIFSLLAGIGSAIPGFLSAILLALVFAVWLHVLPVGGASGVTSLVLPAIAIAFQPTMILSRVVRTECSAAFADHYALAARSRYISTTRLTLVHILPNVVSGSLALGGVIVASLLGSTVIVENVFAWPGLGTAVVQAVLARDYPVVQAIVLLLGIGVLLINFGVDFLRVLADPRLETRRR